MKHQTSMLEEEKTQVEKSAKTIVEEAEAQHKREIESGKVLLLPWKRIQYIKNAEEIFKQKT